MLILTRRIGEKLMIGDDIDVIVLDITNTQVKLGIKAPRSTPILREELIRADLKLLESERLAEQEQRGLDAEHMHEPEPEPELELKPVVEPALETAAHTLSSTGCESRPRMPFDAELEQSEQKTNTIIKTRKKRSYSITDNTEQPPLTREELEIV